MRNLNFKRLGQTLWKNISLLKNRLFAWFCNFYKNKKNPLGIQLLDYIYGLRDSFVCICTTLISEIKFRVLVQNYLDAN